MERPLAGQGLAGPVVTWNTVRMADHNFELGINFTRGDDGKRGSTPAGKAIFAASVRDLDPGLADDIVAAEDWRFTYNQLIKRVAKVEAQSPEAAMQVARSGLAEAHRHFCFVTEEGDQPLETALQSGPSLTTVAITGSGTLPERLEIPYEGEQHSGARLHRLLEEWVGRGFVEPTFAIAVGLVADRPHWLDLRGHTIAVVGAGAEMGPTRQLLKWGATVAAVDIPRRGVWERLVETVKDTPGTLLVPRRDGSDAHDDALLDNAGVDLLTETGAAADWLASLDGTMTVGNYGYLDGAAFVRLSVAFDVMLTALRSRREDLSMAYLATPSDTFLVPMAAVHDSMRRYHELALGEESEAKLKELREQGAFIPFYTEDDVVETDAGRWGLVTGFILGQGQNYALAKRIQRWRVITERADGMMTSVHVAPPTKTLSVRHNPDMARRQRLAPLIGEVAFDAETSQTTGAAILVHDLCNPGALAWPTNEIRHPHVIFMDAANPGGTWRVPFDSNSAVDWLEAYEAEHDVEIHDPMQLIDVLPFADRLPDPWQRRTRPVEEPTPLESSG